MGLTQDKDPAEGLRPLSAHHRQLQSTGLLLLPKQSGRDMFYFYPLTEHRDVPFSAMATALHKDPHEKSLLKEMEEGGKATKEGRMRHGALGPPL